jgi:GTPase KRas protein
VIVNDVPVVLDILDTAGPEEYWSFRDQWITRREAFMVVYSVTDRSSFEAVNTFFELIKRVKELKETDQMLPIALIGNKIDLTDERVVSYEEGRNFAKDCGFPIFMECSTKTNENIDQIFIELTRYCRELRPFHPDVQQQYKYKSKCSVM